LTARAPAAEDVSRGATRSGLYGGDGRGHFLEFNEHCRVVITLDHSNPQPVADNVLSVEWQCSRRKGGRMSRNMCALSAGVAKINPAVVEQTRVHNFLVEPA
jgi:hypothetical protein